MLLKWKRPELPREVSSTWIAIVIGMTMVLAGLIGNVLRNPKVPQYFVLYFGCAALVVFIMFQRIRLLRVVLSCSRALLNRTTRLHRRFDRKITEKIKNIYEAPIVFFAKSEDLVIMNKAVLYVRENEQTSRMAMVHVYDPEVGVPANLERHVSLLDAIYPKLRIDLVTVQGKFGPSMIDWISQHMNVPKNMVRSGQGRTRTDV